VSTEPALEIIVQHDCPKKCIPPICGKMLGQFTVVRVSKLAKQPLLSYAMRLFLPVDVLIPTCRCAYSYLSMCLFLPVDVIIPTCRCAISNNSCRSRQCRESTSFKRLPETSTTCWQYQLWDAPRLFRMSSTRDNSEQCPFLHRKCPM
jgi:hypothetical protein